jgi:predicted GIY-YIG superfamily endonuclease
VNRESVVKEIYKMEENISVTEEDIRRMKPHFVYILECKDGWLYCGVSVSIIRRIIQHVTKRGAQFTRRCPPVGLLHLELLPSYWDAVNIEKKIWREIRWGRLKKDDAGHCIMKRYINIYETIQDLLSRYDSKWVINKLEGIEEEARGVE